MKYRFFLIALSLFLISCDDGDIIVTDFSFDEISLELCETTDSNGYIYFKINNTTLEAISLNFTESSFSEATEGAFDLTLSSTNKVVYRKFNTEIDNTYYCGVIPPSNVSVVEEYVSTGGSASVVTAITDEDDGDGIDAIREDLNGNGDLEDDDTDGDGIPNYKDQDDDNDNILTVDEISNDNSTITFLNTDNDTDADGNPIYNHLDNDDDGDGVLTKFEDLDGNSDPTNDRMDSTTLAYYLDPTAATEVDETKKANIVARGNSVQTEYTTTILFTNLVLEGLDQTVVNENLTLLGTRTQTTTISSP